MITVVLSVLTAITRALLLEKEFDKGGMRR